MRKSLRSLTQIALDLPVPWKAVSCSAIAENTENEMQTDGERKPVPECVTACAGCVAVT